MGLLIKFTGSALVIIALLLVFYRMLVEQGFVPANLTRNQKGKSFLQSLGLVISTQLAVFFCGFTIFQAVHEKMNFFKLEDIWFSGYAKKIALIASQGFTANDIQGSGSLPFYPLLLNAVDTFTKSGFLIAGIIISTVALIIASYFLYQLTVMDFEEKVGWNSVKFLLFYPFIFFLYLSTPDSLFLAFSVGAFYFLRSKKWIAVGILSLLAVLCDWRGILLILPILYELYAEKIKDRKSLFAIAGVVIGLLAIVLYSAYKLGGIGTLMKQNINSFNFIKLVIPQDNLSKLGTLVPLLVLLALSLIGVFYALGRMRLSYLIYVVPFIIVSFYVQWIGMNPRQFALAFPLFIVLGMLSKNKTLNILMTFLCISFMGLYLYSFINFGLGG